MSLSKIFDSSFCRIDTFLLNVDKDIGVIEKVTLRHDNSYLGPGWYLEKVCHMFRVEFEIDF